MYPDDGMRYGRNSVKAPFGMNRLGAEVPKQG
jgi:hypothetical protein